MTSEKLPKSSKDSDFFHEWIVADDDMRQRLVAANQELRAENKVYDEFTDNQHIFITRFSIGAIASYVVTLTFLYRNANNLADKVTYSFEAWHILGFIVAIICFTATVILFRIASYFIFNIRKLKTTTRYKIQVDHIKNKKDAMYQGLSSMLVTEDEDPQKQPRVKWCKLGAWTCFVVASIITICMLVAMGVDANHKLSQKNQSNSTCLCKD